MRQRRIGGSPPAFNDCRHHSSVRAKASCRARSISGDDAIAHAAGTMNASLRLRTPLCRDLLVVSNGEAIVASDFVAPARTIKRDARDAVLAEAARQVCAYFNRRLRRFDLPLALKGTMLQVDAWRAVATLRFAEFVSYADVARAIGRPMAHRGVAYAMAQTPLDLFIPAHRVIGADGRIKGAAPKSLRVRLAAFEAFNRLGRKPSFPAFPLKTELDKREYRRRTETVDDGEVQQRGNICRRTR
jgi:methylated-DNA-[protein]-cysteine S-methyltransferase